MLLRVLSLLCCACSFAVVAAPLPVPDQGPALRIQGSNTIGAALGPALVKGLMEHRGLQSVHSEPGGGANEQRVVGKTRQGKTVIALCDPQRVRALFAVADGVKDSSREAIEQLAQIFNGEISTWEALGGIGGPIHLYARDDQSGTYDTFKELVLRLRGKPLAASAKRFESSEQLSDAVSRDPQGIGFIGLPYVRQAKAVAIVDGDSQPMLPLNSLIATEDYPLSRRLFFYLPPSSPTPWAKALVDFTQSSQGQAIVAANGFIAQQVQAMAVEPRASMPEDYQAIARDAQRLTVNFRFEEGSASLDNKARQDLQRVVAYLKSHDKLNKQVTLVGFGDAKDDPQRAALLSKLRAMAVRRELVKSGVVLRDIRGFGAQMPVAANTADEGRIKNRRVEVWVY